MTTFAAALREAGSAKEIGLLAGKPYRTVERWMRDEAEPSASVVLRLIGRSKPFARAVLRAAGLTDLELELDAIALLRRAEEQAAKRAARQEAAHATRHALDRQPPPRPVATD